MDGFNDMDIECPGCAQEKLIEQGIDTDRAEAIAMRQSIGLPLDDDRAHEYLLGLLGHGKVVEEDLGDPTEVMYSHDTITKPRFLSLWYNVWGFCACHEPQKTLRAMYRVLNTIGRGESCPTATPAEHFLVMAMNAMGLIDHREGEFENSRLTPQGILIQTFLDDIDIDALFDEAEEFIAQQSQSVKVAIIEG